MDVIVVIIIVIIIRLPSCSVLGPIIILGLKEIRGGPGSSYLVTVTITMLLASLGCHR